MKNIKKIFAVFLALVLAATLCLAVACNGKTPAEEPEQIQQNDKDNKQPNETPQQPAQPPEEKPGTNENEETGFDFRDIFDYEHAALNVKGGVTVDGIEEPIEVNFDKDLGTAADLENKLEKDTLGDLIREFAGEEYAEVVLALLPAELTSKTLAEIFAAFADEEETSEFSAVALTQTTEPEDGSDVFWNLLQEYADVGFELVNGAAVLKIDFTKTTNKLVEELQTLSEKTFAELLTEEVVRVIKEQGATMTVGEALELLEENGIAEEVVLQYAATADALLTLADIDLSLSDLLADKDKTLADILAQYDEEISADNFSDKIDEYAGKSLADFPEVACYVDNLKISMVATARLSSFNPFDLLSDISIETIVLDIRAETGDGKDVTAAAYLQITATKVAETDAAA